MHHPKDRQQRRAVRDGIIARRKFIVTRIWSRGSYSSNNEHEKQWLADMQWGKYAKFNLNCGCRMCHSSKYLSAKRKRRNGLHAAESQNDFRRHDRTIKY
jgi:hypothetical protein